MNRIRTWARQLKTATFALYLAYRDPRTPWYARAFTAAVVAYALSPIDLIPDFIPVFGYLDDLLIVPAGIFIAIRLIPPEVMADCRARAAQERPPGASRAASIVIVGIWVALGTLALIWLAQAIAIRT